MSRSTNENSVAAMSDAEIESVAGGVDATILPYPGPIIICPGPVIGPIIGPVYK